MSRTPALELLWYPGSALAYLIIVHASRTIRGWMALRRTAYRLSDEAVARLNDRSPGESTRVQLTEGFSQRFPPRLLYAAVVVKHGEPVKMYRGWKAWDDGSALLDPAGSTTTGLACREVRLAASDHRVI